MRTLHLDLETYSDIDLRKSGLYKYVQSPFFEILLLGYAWDNDPVEIVDLAQGEPIPAEVLAALSDPQVVKMAHNAAFEIGCLSTRMTLALDQWHCTMIHAYYLRYPGSLAALTTALNLPSDTAKNRMGAQLIRTFCVPCKPTASNGQRTRILPHHEPEKWGLFKEYCKQDVVAERAVDARLSLWPVPDREWQLWRTDQRINKRGVAIDTDLVEHALEMAFVVKNELGDEAAELSGLDNPNSVQQLKQYLELQTGDVVESLAKADVASMIATTEDPDVQRVLEIRQEMSKTSVKKYQAMADVVGFDGRARGLLQFYGTGTGRWAGRLIQVQNLPRNHMDDEMLDLGRDLVHKNQLEAVKFVFGNVPDTLSQLVRTAFVPAPGNRLIICDFSAIEARVIAWLAKEQWRMEVFATTGKIYEASAAQMFGVPVDKIVRGNPEYELRSKGKVAELALGYQGGAAALIAMGALQMGIKEEELPDIVQRWRTASPRIRDLWYAMDNCAIAAIESGQEQHSHGISYKLEMQGIDTFLTVLLPSQRKLHYPRPFLGPNKWGGQQIYFYAVNQTTGRWEKTPTYGGKLTENIVQAIARDCLALAIERLEAAGYPVVMHIHDEVVIDMTRNVGSLEEVRRLMVEPIPWAPGLQLDAAGFEGDYYKKD